MTKAAILSMVFGSRIVNAAQEDIGSANGSWPALLRNLLVQSLSGTYDSPKYFRKALEI